MAPDIGGSREPSRLAAIIERKQAFPPVYRKGRFTTTDINLALVMNSTLYQVQQQSSCLAIQLNLVFSCQVTDPVNSLLGALVKFGPVIVVSLVVQNQLSNRMLLDFLLDNQKLFLDLLLFPGGLQSPEQLDFRPEIGNHQVVVSQVGVGG